MLKKQLIAPIEKSNQKDMDSTLYSLLCWAMIPAILVGAIYLWMVDTMVPKGMETCLFRQVFQLYCPGCGGTRAVKALLRGDIVSALYYHFPALFFMGYFAFFYITQSLNRLTRGKIRGIRFRPIYLYIAIGLLVVNVMIRNLLLVVWDYPTL